MRVLTNKIVKERMCEYLLLKIFKQELEIFHIHVFQILLYQQNNLNHLIHLIKHKDYNKSIIT